MPSKLRELLTAGFDKELRSHYADALCKNNGKTARALSAMGAILCGVIMAATFARPYGNWGAVPFYLVVLLSMLLCTFTPDWEHGHKRGTAWLYTTVGFIYSATALHSLMIAPQERDMGICLALAVLPSLILDVGWHTLMPGLVTVLFYLPLFALHGTPDVFAIRAADILLSFIIGAMLAGYHLRSRSRELTLRDSLVGERDTDTLTKVMTRGAAEERIREILEGGALPCAMIMVDVDNFKSVNDTYGHGYGDIVLEEISALLRRSFRSTDIVCRLGGDEFMVLVVGAPEGDWLRNKADEILHQLSTNPIRGRHDFYATISMGAVNSPKYGTEYEKLYLKADRALYDAKKHGKNQCCIFGEEETAKQETKANT